MGLAAPLDARAIEALVRDGVRRTRRRPPALPPPDDLVARGLAGLHRRGAGVDRARGLPRGPAVPRPGAAGAHRLALPPPLARRRALARPRPPATIPNNARIVREARARGFQNALSLDQQGHVAETASTNVFLVRDGVVDDPGRRTAPSSTASPGSGSSRSCGPTGSRCVEATLDVADFAAADEIFLTGNASKVDAGHPLRGPRARPRARWRPGPARSTGTTPTRVAGPPDAGTLRLFRLQRLRGGRHQRHQPRHRPGLCRRRRARRRRQPAAGEGRRGGRRDRGAGALGFVFDVRDPAAVEAAIGAFAGDGRADRRAGLRRGGQLPGAGARDRARTASRRWSTSTSSAPST